MLGFGKTKKKEKEEKKSNKKKEQKAVEGSKEDKDDSKAVKKKTKKRFSKKIIFIILLILIAVGASGYVVYTIYFTSNDPFAQDAKYKAIDLEHINLPNEMMEFTFTNFRELYISLIDFNKEIRLLNKEIERIESIEKKYPDQKKITDKEKKVWEKVKKTLEKTIIKIEKPIKKLYVLLSVNREQGMEQIQAKKSELSELATNALKSANEKTLKLKTEDKVPEGFIKRNIYKLKKKFL
jgi:flagellar basal body-associated protein FliL